MTQFRTKRRVQFAETDMAGIVHFAEFYRYMEQAEHEYFRSLGLSIMQPAGDDAYIGWPRVSATCTFEAPAYFEDELDVLLNVTRKGVKSLTMEIEFWRGGVRIAHGRLKTACCICRHHQPLESIAIPAEYDEKIQEAENPQP